MPHCTDPGVGVYIPTLVVIAPVGRARDQTGAMQVGFHGEGPWHVGVSGSGRAYPGSVTGDRTPAGKRA